MKRKRPSGSLIRSDAQTVESPLGLPVDAHRHHDARSRAHRPDQRVVGVEYGYSGVGESFHQLALGLRDGGLATELTDMGHADVEHECDIGRCYPAQVGNVADAPSAHFGDQKARRRPDPCHRQGDAELIVEIADRRHRWPGGLEKLREHILSGGFARRAGNCEHAQVPCVTGIHLVTRQGAQGRQWIRHHQHNPLSTGRETSAATGTVGASAGDEVMAVGSLTSQGHEQSARRHGTGVRDQ